MAIEYRNQPGAIVVDLVQPTRRDRLRCSVNRGRWFVREQRRYAVVSLAVEGPYQVAPGCHRRLLRAKLATRQREVRCGGRTGISDPETLTPPEIILR